MASFSSRSWTKSVVVSSPMWVGQQLAATGRPPAIQTHYIHRIWWTAALKKLMAARLTRICGAAHRHRTNRKRKRFSFMFSMRLFRPINAWSAGRIKQRAPQLCTCQKIIWKKNRSWVEMKIIQRLVPLLAVSTEVLFGSHVTSGYRSVFPVHGVNGGLIICCD